MPSSTPTRSLYVVFTRLSPSALPQGPPVPPLVLPRKMNERLKAARDAGLATIGFCFQPAEAATMAGAGTEILCLDLGFAEWRELREADHAQAMDGAIARIRDMMRAANATATEKRFVVFGGPVGTPRDWAQILEHTGVDGYVGGSTIERFPTAGLIASTVREFKAVGQPVASTERQTIRLVMSALV